MRDEMTKGQNVRIDCRTLTQQDLSRLVRLAENASSQRLLYGEPSPQSGVDIRAKRMEAINHYLKRQKGEDYFIRIDGAIAGYASIWDGWLAVLTEYEHPQVELAFIDPTYKHLETDVKRALEEEIDDLAKG